MEIKENPSMYQQIFLILQQQILQGEIAEGKRIPTEKELMQQYSTSRITASRAVRELENLGYV
ncbi:MAG: GntR family transcriptional regulator, partial [Sphaerochaeta sp.]|nr:GntR family transcriptional regulator [Sphaerochaeta sp.]